MKYAFVIDGVIDHVSLQPQSEPYIEVSDDVFGGFVLIDGEWFAPTAPQPTPEELRAAMRPLTPREFRDALIDIEEPKGPIMPDDVTAAINQIQDTKARAKALNAWEYPSEFTRTDPLIEQIAASFGLTPEDIDALWTRATEA